MMVTWHGRLFRTVDNFSNNLNVFWSNQRIFFHNHKTLYEILFLMIYFIEQLILFMVILLYPYNAQIFAGVFLLIFITTISFEKIFMESRYKVLEQSRSTTDKEMENLIKQYNALSEECDNLRMALKSKISKGLKKDDKFK